MRKLAAHYVLPGNGQVLKYGIVCVNDNGTIVDVIDTKSNFQETAGTEFYSGVITPGFVNAHCHIELSHLKGKITKQIGLPSFIQSILSQPQVSNEEKQKAIQKALVEMKKTGTVAVGDVCNAAASFKQKSQSTIYFHNFIEVLGFHPSRAEGAFNYCKEVKQEAEKQDIPSTIVPHAPYSISKELFELINKATKKKDILSIHNQENRDEDQLYREKEGAMKDHLENNLNMDLSFFSPSGKGSLQTILPYIDQTHQLLLVHNTYTSKEDVDFLKQERQMANTFLVLCPNSNLYIDQDLPDVKLFLKEDLQLCIGTDSLSSNTSLSLLKEMKTLQTRFNLSLNDLVKMASLNGAKALKIEDRFGTIEKGKQCGINLISNLNMKDLLLTDQSMVRPLV